MSDFAVIEQNVIGFFGDDGRRWLDSLPGLLESCAARWRLDIGPPFDDLSINYVAPATLADGRQIVLKLGVPHVERQWEIAAVKMYGGHGNARLLDADPREGIMLLESLQPGRMLVELGPENDAEATRIAARLMKRLWKPLDANHPFDTVDRWAQAFNRMRQDSGSIPGALAAEADAIFQNGLATTKTNVLLHGDLHHYNILSAEREPWLAIDPKGVAGDPAYEAGALLRNPMGVEAWPDLAAIQSRRLDILAEELDLPRERIQAWAIGQAVLSAWWSYEGPGDEGLAWLNIVEALRAA